MVPSFSSAMIPPRWSLQLFLLAIVLPFRKISSFRLLSHHQSCNHNHPTHPSLAPHQPKRRRGGFQFQEKGGTSRGRISSSSLFYNRPSGNSEENADTQAQAQFTDEDGSRMDLVRKLQRLYYQNETSGVDHDHFGVYDNMPILRSTRVELPGFQSLWNITDPLEIHMFLKVVHSESPRYFGHLHMADVHQNYEIQDFTSLAGGAIVEQQDGDVSAEEAVLRQLKHQQEQEFLARNRYKVGTLMQLSDHYQDSNTGHLLVLVQALARFVVAEGSMERWDWMSLEQFQHNPVKQDTLFRKTKHLPTVQRASVELLPDEEFVQHFTQKAKETVDSYDFSLNHDVQGAACAGAIAEASEWRFFETQQQQIPLPGQMLDPVASLCTKSVAAVSQNIQTAMQEYLSQSPMELHQGECSLHHHGGDEDDFRSAGGGEANDNGEAASLAAQQHVWDVERSVWLELDKLVKNLSQLNPKANTQMPVPTQVLSLLPHDNMNWPEDFGLALYVRQLVRAHAVLAKNKYKFYHGFQLVPKDYPPLRRARRLSYILWNVFLEQDTMDVPSGEMQRVLEIQSIAKRLESGLLQLQTINRILQTLIGS